MGCGGSKAAAAPAAAKTAPEGDYKVVLERNGDAETLGLTIVGIADHTLLVERLKEEGLVPAFNKTVENTPEGQVNAGDYIVAVNTVFGDVEAMRAQLKEKTVNLTMKRKAAEAPAAEATAATPAAPATEGNETAPVAEPAAEPAAAAEEAKATDAAPTEEPKAAEGEAASAEPAPATAEAEAAPAPTEEPAPQAETAVEPASIQASDEDQLVPIAEEPLETQPEKGKSVCC